MQEPGATYSWRPAPSAGPPVDTIRSADDTSRSRRPIVASLRAAGCVFAEDEAELLIAAAATPADLTEMVDQRVSGTPLEYILGWAEFCGLRIAVEPGVFVPRQRTAFLVDEAVPIARPGGEPLSSLTCAAAQERSGSRY